MTNDDLKYLIKELVDDEDELNQIIVLEGDEFADGAIGLSEDNHVIYDYNKTVESLEKCNNWSEEEAIEWIEYNTIRSLAYMDNIGKKPIILRGFY